MLRLHLDWRPSLLTRFALVSAFTLALLGAALFHVLQSGIRSRAIADARQAGVLMTHAVIAPKLGATELHHDLRPTQIAVLDAVSRRAKSTGVRRIKLWDRSGRIVYSDDHGLIGHRFTPGDELRRALGGTPASEVSTLESAENFADRGHGPLLEVYAPLTERGRVVGAFEIYLPYAPVGAAIRHDIRTLAIALLVGLLLLWLALFRIVGDASARLRREAERNEHLALHDVLTELPNRTLFLDRAEQAILAAERDGTEVGVLILDIDRFNDINDTLGDRAGDYLLRQVEPKIRTVLREGDTVARFGADEFAVLLPRLHDGQLAVRIAHRLRQALDQPILVEDLPLAVEATVGIALFPDDATDAATLVRRADVALHMAKAARTGVERYERHADEHKKPRLSLLGELRGALADGELTVHYQPQLSVATEDLRSVEALVRWRHPRRGELLPAAFLPLAEQTRLIRPLTSYVLRAALADVQRWRERGLDFGVAVNLSVRSLADEHLPTEVGTLLAELGVEAQALTLEITESAIMSDPFRAASILARLSKMGIRLSIDDFGAGYSSLGYLKRLPLDELKIDRSFVARMSLDGDDAAIVRSTVELARSLRLHVVAEGVETGEALDQLRSWRCDSAQGFFFARPMPAEKLERWAAEHEPARRAAPARGPLAAGEHR